MRNPFLAALYRQDPPFRTQERRQPMRVPHCQRCLQLAWQARQAPPPSANSAQSLAPPRTPSSNTPRSGSCRLPRKFVENDLSAYR